MEKKLGRHVFVFNEADNGGESLALTTDFFDNGDGEIFTHQQMELQSYCNSASLNLLGAQITPELLRNLANEMEVELNKHKAKL